MNSDDDSDRSAWDRPPVADDDDDDDSSSYGENDPFGHGQPIYMIQDYADDDDDDDDSDEDDSANSSWGMGSYEGRTNTAVHLPLSVLAAADDLFKKDSILAMPREKDDSSNLDGTTQQELSDEYLITNVLQKLEFAELNQTNHASDNLLLKAAKHNRSGDVSHTDGNNIIKWLLQNPNFILPQVPNDNGDNALHLAMSSALCLTEHEERTRNIGFYVTSRGGFVGRASVSRNAVRTLISDSNFCRLAINAPNRDGETPLVRAMRTSVDLVIQDAGNFTKKSNPQIAEFRNDCIETALILVHNEHLRLHGMFDVSFLNSWYKWPRRRIVANGKNYHFTSLLRRYVPGLNVLSSYCKPRANFRSVHDSNLILSSSLKFGHEKVLNAILSDDSGGVNARQKALVLVTYFSPKKQWIFQPQRGRNSAVLRQLFVKYAKPCVRALYVLQNEIVRQAKLLLLLDSRPAMLDIDTWGEILEFANWRKVVTADLASLQQLSQEIYLNQGQFFLGGIRSCFERKYGLEDNTWKLIMEFSGWCRTLPSIDLIPEVTIKQVNRKRRLSCQSSEL